jgi:hypothetical protein
MEYRVSIDDVTGEQWEKYAKVFADYNIYQTWPYQQVRAEMGRQGVSRAIVTDETGNPVTICQLRISNVKALHLRIGYVQWGPLLRCRNGDAGCLVEALRLLRESYVGYCVDVLRLVLNVPDDEAGNMLRQTFMQGGFEHVVHYKPYRTLLLRVDDLPEQIRSRFRRNFRSNLKKAENAGLELRQGTEDEFCNVLNDLYLASIRRKGFKGLNPEVFIRSQILLSPSEKLSFFVASPKGEPMSVLLASALGDTSLVLLAAANEKGLS